MATISYFENRDTSACCRIPSWGARLVFMPVKITVDESPVDVSDIVDQFSEFHCFLGTGTYTMSDGENLGEFNFNYNRDDETISFSNASGNSPVITEGEEPEVYLTAVGVLRS